MENTLKIIKATEQDFELLSDFRMKFIFELSRRQEDEEAAELRNELRKFYSRSESETNTFSLLAVVNEKTVAVACLHIHQVPGTFKNPSGIWGYIMNVYTEPEYRNRGISSALMNALRE